MRNLRITEIFLSLQGESQTMGLPTVFVRLTGCPLRCHYCDTAYAFTGGESLSLEAIVQQVVDHRISHVTVTGGEPLAQKNCLILLRMLCDFGFQVSLETSGAILVDRVDPRVHRVLDIKTPGSGEVERNQLRNMRLLRLSDEVKFVICSDQDYQWSKQFIQEYALADRCQLLFSPSHEQLSPGKLADWVLQDRLPVRFQIQMHKILWGDQPGR